MIKIDNTYQFQDIDFVKINNNINKFNILHPKYHFQEFCSIIDYNYKLVKNHIEINSEIHKYTNERIKYSYFDKNHISDYKIHLLFNVSKSSDITIKKPNVFEFPLILITKPFVNLLISKT